MAHAAATSRADRYSRLHFMIRGRPYRGLATQGMRIGPLADDERLKMVLPQACCYCGSREFLAANHLIARKRGGADTGDDLVWVCRSCNSSKAARDALEWLAERGRFPPLLLLRRYLKLAIDSRGERNAMDAPLAEAPALPFALSAIPRSYPQPGELQLWVTDLP